LKLCLNLLSIFYKIFGETKIQIEVHRSRWFELKVGLEIILTDNLKNMYDTRNRGDVRIESSKSLSQMDLILGL